MKSWLRWILISTGIVVVTLVLLVQHFVHSSGYLDSEIKTQIPLGTPKAKVVTFIQRRHPVSYDDTGAQLKVRLQELPENKVFRRDFALTFEFSPDGKLLSCSTKVYLTFQ
jgi:hypothetical protein